MKKVAKKKTQQKTNAMHVMEQRRAPYKEYGFVWDEDHLSVESIAESLGIEKGRIFKTLVTVGNKIDPVVAVIPGSQELDLKKLTRASGSKKVEILHLRDLEAATGYTRGDCSPVRMKK